MRGWRVLPLAAFIASSALSPVFNAFSKPNYKRASGVAIT